MQSATSGSDRGAHRTHRNVAEALATTAARQVIKAIAPRFQIGREAVDTRPSGTACKAVVMLSDETGRSLQWCATHT